MKHHRAITATQSWLNSRRQGLLHTMVSGIGAAAFVLLAGCGPVKLVASTNIPPPLVVKIPIAVALFVPQEFSSYVHKEERWSTDWHVDLGRAQTDSMTRLFAAMFERVIPVESVNAGAQVPGGVAAILEPSVEEYAFVTPRDAGSPFYAVSIKYRVNVYLPDGKLADSWGFTGYGTSTAQGLSSQAPLSAATALAMRDAGAKLAVEFREQAVLRGLLPGSESADSPQAPATPEAPGAAPMTTEPAPSETPAGTPAGEVATGEVATGEPGKSDPPAAESSAEDAAPAGQDEAAKEPAQSDEKPQPPIEPEALALSLPFS